VWVDTADGDRVFRTPQRLADGDGTNGSIPVNAFREWGSDPEPAVSEPVGVSHVAVVTADLDGFRAFYEETIGLDVRGCTNTHPQRSEP